MTTRNHPTCVFCSLPQERVEQENKLAICFYDGYPVSPGHTLIIPRRHFPELFSATGEEIIAMYELILLAKERLLSNDKSISGFNLGVNIGKSAGQTVLHTHLHLIPRRNGDTPYPKGGVRGVIPDKMSY